MIACLVWQPADRQADRLRWRGPHEPRRRQCQVYQSQYTLSCPPGVTGLGETSCVPSCGWRRHSLGHGHGGSTTHGAKAGLAVVAGLCPDVPHSTTFRERQTMGRDDERGFLKLSDCPPAAPPNSHAIHRPRRRRDDPFHLMMDCTSVFREVQLRSHWGQLRCMLSLATHVYVSSGRQGP